MDIITATLIPVIIALIASSGFWAFLMSRSNKKSAQSKLILGLGYEAIATQGKEYIERGWITLDEYEGLRKYLYEPYAAMGGNGLAEKIMKEVDKLPIKEEED